MSMIQSWYSSIDGKPGFMKDALTALKAKVLTAKRDNQEIICVLMLDEMSMRKHVKWDTASISTSLMTVVQAQMTTRYRGKLSFLWQCE